MTGKVTGKLTGRRRRLLAWLLAGAVAGGLGWLARPAPHQLGTATIGDPGLAHTVRAAVGDPAGYRGLAVVVVDDETVRFAGLGDRGDGQPVDEDTPFEIGSVTKALTGMLLEDLREAGVAHPDEPLRALLPEVNFAHPATAEVTLEKLASHRSGLPRLRFTNPWQVVAMSLRSLAGRDPYTGQDTRQLLSSVAGAQVDGGEPTVEYSNYGPAVLGHALAERADTPYPALLTERILTPLGMTATTFHLDGAALPQGHAHGGTGGGRAARPWQASGYAPAGIGAWSTARDLAQLVSAMLSDTAPGADAARPRHRVEQDQWVGYGWFTDRIDGQEVTWHNGGTGGFRAWVGYDRAAGRGVVVLGNTDRDVDDLGRWLLAAAQPGGDTGATIAPDPAGGAMDSPGPTPGAVASPGPAQNAVDWRGLVLTIGLSLLGGLGLLFTAARAALDRLHLVASGVWAVTMPALARPLGAWHVIPAGVWVLGVALSAVAAVLAFRRWPGAPIRLGRAGWRWTSTGGSMLTALAALAWIYL